MNKTRILELLIPSAIVFLLAGCFGSGGKSVAYDGTWTVAFADSSFVPPAAASGVAVSCTVQNPLPTVTLIGGAGSTSQRNTCTGTATMSGTQSYIYLISVAINISTGAMSAVVNGSTLSGKCISKVGCAASNGTQSLSLTR